MSCRDEPAGDPVLEQQCPRLTPVVSVPWKAICAHGQYREHRRNELATTPTEISVNSNDAFCGRFLRRSLRSFLDDFARVVSRCRQRNAAGRIGSNHKSSAILADCLSTGAEATTHCTVATRSATRGPLSGPDSTQGRLAADAQVYSEFFQPVFQRGPLAARDSGDDDDERRLTSREGTGAQHD